MLPAEDDKAEELRHDETDEHQGDHLSPQTLWPEREPHDTTSAVKL
jgi:hypothetical protein